MTTANENNTKNTLEEQNKVDVNRISLAVSRGFTLFVARSKMIWWPTSATLLLNQT